MKHCPKCLENGALVPAWIAGNLCKNHWQALFEEALSDSTEPKG